jgi:hypothetical protein
LRVETPQGDPLPIGALLDFGIVQQGDAAPERTLVVYNDGLGPLALGTLYVAQGFHVVDGLASVLPPSTGSDALTVRLDTSTPGRKYGVLGFSNNDSDENPYWVTIVGWVTAAGEAENELSATWLDVNQTGAVTPLDVLLVINYLNEHGSAPVIPGTAEGAYDVNRDGWATPLDVLRLINHLNAVFAAQFAAAGAAAGEGESPLHSLSPVALGTISAPILTSTPRTDAAIRDFESARSGIRQNSGAPAMGSGIRQNSGAPARASSDRTGPKSGDFGYGRTTSKIRDAADLWADDDLLESDLEAALSAIAPDIAMVWRAW